MFTDDITWFISSKPYCLTRAIFGSQISSLRFMSKTPSLQSLSFKYPLSPISLSVSRPLSQIHNNGFVRNERESERRICAIELREQYTHQ